MKIFNLIGFQDPATPIFNGIIDLHNYINFFIVGVLCFVLCIMVSIVYEFYLKDIYFLDVNTLKARQNLFQARSIVHNTAIEIIWTSIPALILMSIAVPSFALLYAMDEVVLPSLIVKIIGHQWYWSYDVFPFNDKGDALKHVAFDSYMKADTDLVMGERRLLEVDNYLYLPFNTHIKLLITSNDVLHSWAMPSLGVKVDAVPGRLSQVSVYIDRMGVFYGQCSEICGVNHGFMPSVIKAVDSATFADIYPALFLNLY